MNTSNPEVPTTQEPGGEAPPVSLYTNLISLVGFFFVGLGLLLLLTFALFAVIFPSSNPYLGIIGFIILPGIFITGLIIVPIGMLWKLWRLRRRAVAYRISYRLPRLDLNNPRTRRGLLGFLAFSAFVVVPVLAVTSYTGYEYTESSNFCGQTCHTVMEPQATAHADSPHARVTCAECHIGAGASWFVKSKISGTRQVFAVWFDTYSRPIPPAITDLRPARETCEQCHWPEKFYGERYQEVVHFIPDEQNTRRVIRMLLKVGGADRSTGRAEGIHMHMLLAGQTEYVARDPHLQDIPWVQYTTTEGVVREYRSDGQPHGSPPPEGTRRRIDCMDCHNRGAHHFYAPQTAVDRYLDAGLIDRQLPYIKREAVKALLGDYPEVASAMTGIERALTEFYQANYPDIAARQAARVQQAAAAVQAIYRRNFFPEMKVDWRTYPENVGHLNSPGCFRCHDGLHVDRAGTPIRSTCEVCHTFLTPAEDQPNTLVLGEFQHAMPLAVHQDLRCSQCHSGGQLPLCRNCHASGEWLGNWQRGEFRPNQD